jgi:hypothetical protein
MYLKFFRQLLIELFNSFVLNFMDIHMLNFDSMTNSKRFYKKNYYRMVWICNDATKQIIKVTSTNPRDLILRFSTWSLRSLAGFLTRQKDSKTKSKSYQN